MTLNSRTSNCYSFDLRARVGRDITEFSRIELTLKFQSTRPRGARHNGRLDLATDSDVSIHAPAWGATEFTAVAEAILSKFQSTRPRGARLVEKLVFIGVNMFQSTRPRGARHDISPYVAIGFKSFNPRARVGRDLIHGYFWNGEDMFQSTRPRGARPKKKQRD